MKDNAELVSLKLEIKSQVPDKVGIHLETSCWQMESDFSPKCAGM